MSDELARYVQTVGELANLARIAALRYLKTGVEVECKADATPVTVADREIERALNAHIRLRHPLDAVVGEEFGTTAPACGPLPVHCWVIDPIDGTRSFLTGSPLWGTLIGVLRDGVPWIGAIEMPALARRWVGVSGTHAFGVSDCVTLQNARLCTTNPDKITGLTRARYDALIRSVAVHRYGGDCFNYALLAMGQCDLVVEAGLALHDVLPVVPVVEAAGGVITDWQGRLLRMDLKGGVLAAASVGLHRQALALLHG